MLETQLRHHLRNLTALAGLAVMMSGCLMQEEIEDPQANVEGDYEISGSVGDGPVVGAAMRVMANDGGILAEFESDATAGYNLTVRTKGRYYPLTIDAINGTDLVTGLAPDFILIGAALEPSKKSVANINPFSTLAMEIARDMPEGVNKSNVESAESIVTTTIGSGLSSIAASGPMRTPIDASNVAEIVKSSEVLGEIIRRTRDWLLVAGFGVSGDSTIQALGSDLTDSVIDGVGGPRAHGHTAAITNIVAAQVLLEASANELHVNDLLANTRLESAIRQIGYPNASPALSELTITPQMLSQITVGLAAADEVSSDQRIGALRTAVTGIRAGLPANLVQSVLPADYRQILDDVLIMLVSADDQMIDTVNDVVRSGGTDPSPNGSPTIDGSPATSIEAGSPYRFQPLASDPDGDNLTFAAQNVPGWASFNTGTGLLSGTPTESDVGEYPSIAISVSDGQSSDSIPPFSVSVVSAVTNSAPIISGTPENAATEGITYSFVPVASDSDNDPLVFSISGRPPWITFNSTSGALEGTPTAADVGVHGDIVISVSDGTASASLPAFSIVVGAIEANTPPSISGTPLSIVTANAAYEFTPTAFDADGDTLTFAVSGLPAWASFSTADGRIAGTPGVADVGDYGGITITVSDGSGTASLGPFAITVEAVSLGSVTLNWTAPTENSDGTALTDLAGYKVYWGTVSGSYPYSVTIDNPGITTYVVENLAPGTYEFVTTAFNTSGVESGYSNVAIIVLSGITGPSSAD